MDRRKLRIAAFALEALALLAMIFFFSSQERETSAALSQGVTRWLLEHVAPGFTSLSETAQLQRIEALHGFIRKCAHFGEFALLGQAFFWLFRSIFLKASLPRCGIFAFGASVLMAAGDELHQSFVAGRGPQLRDVLIDASGALTAIVLIMLFLWIRGRRRPSDCGITP